MTVQKLVIVIRNLDNSEVIERWQFNVECDKTNIDNKMYVIQQDIVVLIVIVKWVAYKNSNHGSRCFLYTCHKWNSYAV